MQVTAKIHTVSRIHIYYIALKNSGGKKTKREKRLFVYANKGDEPYVYNEIIRR